MISTALSIGECGTTSKEEASPNASINETQETSIEPSFNFSDGVPEAQRGLIRETISLALSWQNDRTGIPLEELTVFADDNAGRLVDQYLSRTAFPEPVKAQERQNLLSGATAWAGRQNDMYIFTQAPGWVSSSPIIGGPVREGQMHTLAHEVFHLLQIKLRADNNVFPAWLWEGSAHYMAARFLLEKDLHPYEDITARHIREASKIPEQLESLESWQAFSNAGTPFADEYSLAFLATRHLTEDLPEGGIRELTIFWELVGKGTPWRNALQEVFGRTAQGYYTSFENWRAQGFNS